MKRILCCLFLCICSVLILAGAQNIDKQTFRYAVKNNDTLFLDKYDIHPVDAPPAKKKPCVIFVFGGGFMHGQRYSASYMPFFDYLLKKGYIVVSIDYRLGMNKAKGADINAREFISIFDNSIHMAVEDLYDATDYIIRHAGDWNLDAETIVACGSSAGAITVLHGEYGISNSSELSERLPRGFNYAGIISFAGAIFTQTGGLKWDKKICPVMMFHGDADRNVPYDHVRLLQIGFYGSKYIANQLRQRRSPFYFYDKENAGHEMAVDPITDNQNEIDTFLDTFVKDSKVLIIHQKVDQPDMPPVEKSFGIKDYIKANMGGETTAGF